MKCGWHCPSAAPTAAQRKEQHQQLVATSYIQLTAVEAFSVILAFTLPVAGSWWLDNSSNNFWAARSRVKTNKSACNAAMMHIHIYSSLPQAQCNFTIQIAFMQMYS